MRVAHPGSGRPRTRLDRVRADQAYASRKNRAYLRRHGIRCTIPDKADQARTRKKLGSRGSRPPKFDAEEHGARMIARSCLYPCGTFPRSRKVSMDVLDAPDRPGGEFVFVARRP
ncbi:hypothetical protein [Streptomyces sp. NPDC056361]|uniref:hypothetical protein n=1 Tax=Streptomyces sp. NPDC056361 TaxID=3345795 RepID=UPI0035DC9E2B